MVPLQKLPRASRCSAAARGAAGDSAARWADATCARTVLRALHRALVHAFVGKAGRPQQPQHEPGPRFGWASCARQAGGYMCNGVLDIITKVHLDDVRSHQVPLGTITPIARFIVFIVITRGGGGGCMLAQRTIRANVCHLCYAPIKPPKTLSHVWKPLTAPADRPTGIWTRVWSMIGLGRPTPY